jgi:DNA-binding MarR family transcriptional regulator
LDQREERMWRAFMDMRVQLDRAIERQLTDAGLSSADYQLLVPLSETPEGMRARDLGNHAGWDRSRLSHHLGRMERRGLITRRDCPDDARGTVIALTPTGRKAIEAAAPGHAETVRRYFVDLLTDEEIDTLTTIATRIRDNASAL